MRGKWILPNTHADPRAGGGGCFHRSLSTRKAGKRLPDHSFSRGRWHDNANRQLVEPRREERAWFVRRRVFILVPSRAGRGYPRIERDARSTADDAWAKYGRDYEPRRKQRSHRLSVLLGVQGRFFWKVNPNTDANSNGHSHANPHKNSNQNTYKHPVRLTLRFNFAVYHPRLKISRGSRRRTHGQAFECHQRPR